jgi:glucosamine 6-phosphate synthetase-like amidotransferase/phosphosugar isomerase protein
MVIAIVHNGIIENYSSSERAPARKGNSHQTDTEVIAHLVEKF